MKTQREGKKRSAGVGWVKITTEVDRKTETEGREENRRTGAYRSIQGGVGRKRRTGVDRRIQREGEKEGPE